MMNRREFLASILKLSAALPALAVLPFVGKTAAATAYTLSVWVKHDSSPWQYVSVVGDGSEPLTLYVDGEQVSTIAPAYPGKEIAAQIMENFVKYDIPGNDPGTNWGVLGGN